MISLAHNIGADMLILGRARHLPLLDAEDTTCQVHVPVPLDWILLP